MRDTSYPGRSNILSTSGIAATSNPLSTLEAISILKKGGNAIDASIAASAVQSVVEPGSTGIGGDCFALISINGKKPLSVNGSGIASKNSNIDFFKKKGIKKISPTSPHSVTIPGAVHAWYTMHQKFGKLDFEQLFITAENYALNGYPVYEIAARDWNENLLKLSKNQNSKKIFLNKNKPYQFAQIHKNIPLAKTLNSIGKKGIEDFYRGYIAQDIVNSLNELGGNHSIDDFAMQSTILEDSISNTYKDKIIHQCPPNGPGITVLIMMAMLEKFNFKNIHAMSAKRFHFQAEITKIAYEIKEKYLGDKKFIDFNSKNFLNKKYINFLSNKINLNKCYHPTHSLITAHPETVYLTVVDRDLNSVSFINSLCFGFGSGITTKKTGILLQNRGVNFRLDESHPNKIDSHKRPLHTIIPGIVNNKKNQTILTYGVMGGQYQPIGHAHFLQNLFEFNMSVQESIDFPRAFHLNGQYLIEKLIPKKIKKELKIIGHNIKYSEKPHGGSQAIFIDRKKGVLIGGSDSRKDGCAIGI